MQSLQDQFCVPILERIGHSTPLLTIWKWKSGHFAFLYSFKTLNFHSRTVSVSISYSSSSTKNGASSPHSHPWLRLARAIECLLACLGAIFARFHNQAPMQKEAYIMLLRSLSHGGTVIGVWNLAAEYITGKLESILLFSRLNTAIALRMRRAACSKTKA